MIYIVKEHVYLYTYLGVDVGFGSSSSINGSDEMLGCKCLPLCCVRSIENEELRFFTSRMKKKRHSMGLSDRESMREIMSRVHRSPPGSFKS